jgi:hypothetical protein
MANLKLAIGFLGPDADSADKGISPPTVYANGVELGQG